MGYNELFDQRSRKALESILPALSPLYSQWKHATTLESRRSAESALYTAIDLLTKQQYQVELHKKGSLPTLQSILHLYLLIEMRIRARSVAINQLAEQYIDIYNTAAMQLQGLLGTARRVRQKLAVLRLWSKEKARYAFLESFDTMRNLNADQLSAPSCFVQLSQGVATLPIESSTRLKANRIQIDAGSNGRPGNSDLAVTVRDNSLKNVLKKTESWFEYERLGTGPLRLEISVFFPKEEIVNGISLRPAGTSTEFRVAEVFYTNANNEKTSFTELFTADKPEALSVKKAGRDTEWNIVHLPTKAKSVSLVLVQNKSQLIEYATPDARVVTRKRFAIGIQQLSFWRHSFSAEGALGSKVLAIPPGLFAMLPFVQVKPVNSQLHTLTLDVSFDSGRTWETRDIGNLSKSFLLDGTKENFLWKLRVERNDTGFRELEDFESPVSYLLKTESFRRRVSGQESPVKLTLSSKPPDGEVMVLETGLLKRGDRRDIVPIGTLSEDEQSFRLPILMGGYLDERDLDVFVRQRRLERTRFFPNLGSWKLSDNLQEVEVPSDSSASEVQVVLKPERMQFEEYGDWMLHRTELLFDPDKDAIRIEYLERSQIRKTEFVPRERLVHNLSGALLLSGETHVKSISGTDWTQVSQKTDLASATKSYWVDTLNGVLHLSEETGDDALRISYTHQSPKELDKQDFEIAYDALRPIGILINKSVFEAERVTETVSSANFPRIDLKYRETKTEPTLFTTDPKTRNLSHRNILKGSVVVSSGFLSGITDAIEVDFIDGESEFLGLIVSEEETSEITAPSGISYVQFLLAAGALWNRSTLVTFGDTSVFANEVASASAAQTGSVGDYYIYNSGLVTVNVGNAGTLNSGISISYYYRDPQKDTTGLYSVDYRRGVVYASSAMSASGTISYSVAHYVCSYSVAREVSEFSYDLQSNSVSVKTENMFATHPQVRVLWKKPTQNTSLKALKNYYSPIIADLGFRFS